MSNETNVTRYNLIIIGGSAGGLSTAISSVRSGLTDVRIVESGSAVAFPHLVGENQLEVGFGETVTSVRMATDSGDVLIDSNKQSYRTHAVLVADRHTDSSWRPPIDLPASNRVEIDDAHFGRYGGALDVLIVGSSDYAVELTARNVDAGHRVVLAAGGMDPGKLSPAAERELHKIEHERSATLLYRSTPVDITIVNGDPMADFGDRRTPDLQFDRVIWAPPRIMYNPSDIGLTDDALTSGNVWFIGDPADNKPLTTAPGWQVGVAIAEALFPEIKIEPIAPSLERRTRHPQAIEELRNDHYNATITHFEPTHSDLWVLRVKPDSGDTSYRPGQYASLGLGFWETRIDNAPDPDAEQRWDKLIRRSYSISSRMFDGYGYLTDDSGIDELEFYIVLVEPTTGNTPALTPRLALKRVGDRVYMGPKIAGRYTLDAVKDPNAEVIFFGTGTGEAPHNGMIVELLRKGHTGTIVSAVTVRKNADLGYLGQHRELERRYPNYHYLPMPTREVGVPKRYLQDLLRDDDLAEIGVTLSPDSTHVYLCGNPAMIGLPEKGEDGEEHFPETTGVVELLVKRGFNLDRRNNPGNIHYEEYW